MACDYHLVLNPFKSAFNFELPIPGLRRLFRLIPEARARRSLVIPTFAILICILCTFGCASPNTVPRLSDNQCQKLVMAGNEFALKSQPIPKAIQDLHPVDVYYYGGNVIIALRRDAHQECGYCIMPVVSSNFPKADSQWTFKPLANTNGYSGIWEYWRVR
jgi:hypothetical protein